MRRRDGAAGVRALPCGDSDSIGAVFGQIAGAYYGFDAIPGRWVKAVKIWRKVDQLIERFLDALGS